MADAAFLQPLSLRYPHKTKKARRRRRVKAMWKEQGGRCFYCFGRMRHPSDRPTFPGERQTADVCTEDHRHPRVRGGLFTRANLCLACYSCNKAKKTYTAEEFEISHAAWLALKRRVAFRDAGEALDWITDIHQNLKVGLKVDLSPKVGHGFAEAQQAGS